MSFFGKDPAAPNSFKHHEVIEGQREDSITYRANGDVVHATRHHVVHSRLTDFTASDAKSFLIASQTFGVAHVPAVTALPVQEKAKDLLADMRQLRTPSIIMKPGGG